jgi:hypothetical protein
VPAKSTAIPSIVKTRLSPSSSISEPKRVLNFSFLNLFSRTNVSLIFEETEQ